MSDRLERLRTLRDQLTEWLNSNAADRAQLALRLTSVLEQIDVLEKGEPAKEATPLDEIAARRSAKGSGRSARGRL